MAVSVSGPFVFLLWLRLGVSELLLKSLMKYHTP